MKLSKQAMSKAVPLVRPYAGTIRVWRIPDGEGETAHKVWVRAAGVKSTCVLSASYAGLDQASGDGGYFGSSGLLSPVLFHAGGWGFEGPSGGASIHAWRLDAGCAEPFTHMAMLRGQGW